MEPPLLVRELSDAERRELQAGLRSRTAFTLRRAQILLASADGLRPARIAAAGCAVGTVHDTLHAFETEGVGCLTEKKRGPKDGPPILDGAKADPLKGILHYCEEPLVSSDFNGTPYSSILDSLLTRVIDKTFCKVLAWYDNEWGFSNRMRDVAVLVGRKLG